MFSGLRPLLNILIIYGLQDIFVFLFYLESMSIQRLKIISSSSFLALYVLPGSIS
jgi:hypothetical protein